MALLRMPERDDYTAEERQTIEYLELRSSEVRSERGRLARFVYNAMCLMQLKVSAVAEGLGAYETGGIETDESAEEQGEAIKLIDMLQDYERKLARQEEEILRTQAELNERIAELEAIQAELEGTEQ